VKGRKVKKEPQADATDVTGRMLAQLVTCQKLALVGRLSSGITHEVNNHLTGVTGYAQLLLGQDRAKPVARELDKINYSAERCRKLILDFKRFSRFGGAEKEFDNINFIIKASLDLLRHQFIKKSLEVVENYSEDIPPIEVDTPALEQIFLNVIQNSLDALDEKDGCLSITTLKEGEQVVALFEDDGPGLSEDARAHLFTPFFTTKPQSRCLGLGLAAAKVLVEAHEGTIEVDNAPKGGVCVKICLPLSAGRRAGG
jgi:C4-dicarboxylate-specific signal transduction histidine kinase